LKKGASSSGRQPPARREHAPHLARGRGPVREELKSLLAEDGVERRPAAVAPAA
jgi:hypothetical protein